MGLTVTIDESSIGFIGDSKTKKTFGSCFFCLRSDWIFTAKHVIIDEKGDYRPNLAVWPYKREGFAPSILYVHPELDLAVLKAPHPVPSNPLPASSVSMVGSRGLIYIGYSPSKSKEESASVLYINSIPGFRVEKIERSFTEELIVFEASFSEGGNSGGPVLGEGGSAVGVVIQNYTDEKDGKLYARATSLKPLLDQLEFPKFGD